MPALGTWQVDGLSPTRLKCLSGVHFARCGTVVGLPPTRERAVISELIVSDDFSHAFDVRQVNFKLLHVSP